MDLIRLVKDSFEAVVQEVEGAYQRLPADEVDRSENAIVYDKSRPADSPSQTDNNPQTAGTSSVADVVQPDIPDPQTASQAVSTGAPATASVPESVEDTRPPTQTADFPDQLQLLANVMQQASLQLSAAAENSSENGEASNSPSTAFDALVTEQAELRKLYESRIHSDEIQASTFERLHSELQASRQQLQRAEMAPLLKDIVFCHDFITRQLERNESGEESVNWRSSFEVLAQMLLDVLFKYDVEPFRSESEAFDRATQQCVRTEHTTQQNQDRRIATSGLQGFRSNDRIIRREQVTVYRYRPSG